MTGLFIRMPVRRGKRDELHNTLKSLFAQIRSDPGCLNFQMAMDIEDRGTFFCGGVWENEEALHAFFRTRTCTVLIGAIQLLCESPDVRIDPDPTSGDLSLIQAVRESSTISAV